LNRQTIHYGKHHNQVADVWWPSAAQGDLPVVALIHGGFWRQLYTKRLMHDMAAAISGLGWVAYNIEYRRVGALGSGGWPATFDDVSAAINALDTLDGVDVTRVMTCGHSAGGHLALWAAGDRATALDSEPPRVRPALAASLAGVVDLIAAARMNLGGGAVQALMGGGPEEFPDRYRLGSPAGLLPLGVPQLLIHGLGDGSVPPGLSADYVQMATQHGDDATFVPLPGAGHMEMIDPKSRAFDQVVACMERLGPTG
jgi:acetyl esterase/lipase